MLRGLGAAGLGGFTVAASMLLGVVVILAGLTVIAMVPFLGYIVVVATKPA